MSSTIASLGPSAPPGIAHYRAADRAQRERDPAPVSAARPQGDTVRVSGQAIVASVRAAANREILTQVAHAQAQAAPRGGDDAPLSFTAEQFTSALGASIAAIFEEHGIDLSELTDVDVSADATAGRIVDASTAMFASFARQHPDQQGEELIAAFETTLHDAVDAGYGAARTSLDRIGVGSDVVALGAQTMGLVHDKLDAFFQGLRGQQPET